MEQLYVLRDRDGDFVATVEKAATETLKLHFTFTKDHREAKRFTWDDLWSPRQSYGVGTEFSQGYAGGKAIRVRMPDEPVEPERRKLRVSPTAELRRQLREKGLI